MATSWTCKLSAVGRTWAEPCSGTSATSPSADRSARWYFFFQAEDGIRDVAVTGVQTCALPICLYPDRWACGIAGVPVGDYAASYDDSAPSLQSYDRSLLGGTVYEVPDLVRERSRSEERRVGKECRSRWSPYH